MPGPLEGVRVLDVTTMVSGPLATMILGDYGADVVKVEPPEGDPLRYYGSSKNGMSAWYANTNRSKRAITVDLQQPEGPAVLRRLARGVDVVLQNFRPGVMERLGCGYEALAAETPELIYVSVSGFGDEGPYAERRVYDPIIQCHSGLAASQADASGRPQLLRQMISDKLTAWAASQAITTAYIGRLRGMGGQHVKVPMIDAVVSFLWNDAMMHLSLLDDDVNRAPNPLHAYRLAPAADGWLTVGTATDAQYRGMWAALGRPEMGEREEVSTVRKRAARWDEVVAEYEGELSKHPLAELLPLLQGADVACAAALPLDQVAHDPQVVFRGTVSEVAHPVAGRLLSTRPIAEFTGTPAAPSRLAPGPGQHTDEVLADAGFTAGEIAALRESGVVR
jgi:crotonobetainyl-CoA:carnitine CoA-transferase CaiB-like acyl-CoA transferase